MPKHLTGIETVVNLPDPGLYGPGYPVIHEGAIKVVSDTATPTWEIASTSGGGIAGLGHPEQPFLGHSLAQTPATRWNFEWAFDAGSGYKADYEEIYYDSYAHTIDLPQFGTSAHLPNTFKLTLRWWAPVAGTFNLSYAGETGNFDFTISLDDVADTPFTNSPDGTYQIAITDGFHKVDIVIANNTGSVTGSTLSINPFVTATTPPTDGELFYDDYTNTFIQYVNGVPVPVGMGVDQYTNEGNPVTIEESIGLMSSMRVGKTLSGVPRANLAFNRTVSLLGDIGNSGSSYSGGVAIGAGATLESFPSFGGSLAYGYWGTVVGAEAVAWTGGTAIGADSFAGPLGTTVNGVAFGECTALGYGSYAAVPRTAFSGHGGAAVESAADPVGTGGTGTYFYYIRGVDTNGYPITEWDFVTTAILTDEFVTINWTPGNWAAEVTDVQVRRGSSQEYYTFLTATKASGTLLDDFTADDRIRQDKNWEIAFNDFYGWSRDRRAIAIGLYATAQHENSVVIDNDQSASGYAGQFMLGNDGNLVDFKGGEVRRVESVSTTFTCDSSGFSNVVLADPTGGAFNVTLPAAQAGRTITVKKADGAANAVTVVTPGAETIDGAASLAMGTAYETATLISNGTNWFTI